MVGFFYEGNFIEKRMQGELYINNKDAWVTWSAKLVDDSYDNLLLPANPKAYVENDNRSQSGKQVFINNTQLKDRNIQLVFAITCDSRADYLQKLKSLKAEIMEGFFEFKVMSLETIYRFYLPEDCFLSLSTGTGIREGRLSVRVNEPDPLSRQSTLLTASPLSTQGDAITNDQEELLTSDIR